MPTNIYSVQTLLLILSLTRYAISLTQFPQTFGGSSAYTRVSVFELDSSTNNMAMGGQSQDSGMITGASPATPGAFIVLYNIPSITFLWGKSYSNIASLTDVTSLVWSPDSSKLLAGFTASNSFSLALIDTTSGANLFDYTSALNNIQFAPEGLYVDNSGNVYLSGVYISGGAYYSYFAKFNSGSVTMAFGKSILNSATAFSMTLNFNSVTSNFYLGGNIQGAVSVCSISTAGVLNWSYGATSSGSIKKFNVMNWGTQYMKGCYHMDSGPSYLGVVDIVFSSSDVVQSTMITEDRSSTQLKCYSIMATSATSSLMVVADWATSPISMSLVRFDTSAMSSYYMLLETFSTSGAEIFDAKVLYVGVEFYAGSAAFIQTNNPATGAKVTLSQTVGFIQSQVSSACVTLGSQTEGPAKALTSLGSLSSSVPIFASTTFSVGGTPVVSALVQTSLSQLCIGTIPIVVYPSTISNVNFYYSQLTQVITIPGFSYSPNTPSYSFTYSASGLPACGSLSGSTITIASSCSGTTSQSFTITVVGTLSHASETASTSFTLTLNPSTLTPSLISDKTFYYYQLPQTITFTQFGQNPTYSATFSYSATGLPSCGSVVGTSNSIALSNLCSGNAQTVYTVVVNGVFSAGGSVSTSFTLYLEPIALSGSISDCSLYYSTQTSTPITISGIIQTPSAGQTLSYSSTSLPTCASILGSTISFDGTCQSSTVSTQSVTITASLSSGESYSTSFTLTLNPQTITPPNLSDQTISEQDLPETILIPQFTQSPPSSATFSYSMTGLPCGSFNPSTNLITLDSTCTGISPSSYFISVSAILSTGETSGPISFNLNFESLVITPSVISNLTLYESELPYSYLLPEFKIYPDDGTYYYAYSISSIGAQFLFDPSSLSLEIASLSTGTYSLTLSGVVNTGQSAVSNAFFITVLPVKIKSPVIQDQTIDNTMLPLHYEIPQFSQKPETGKSFTYLIIGLPPCAFQFLDSNIVIFTLGCSVEAFKSMKVVITGVLPFGSEYLLFYLCTIQVISEFKYIQVEFYLLSA